MGSGLIRSFSGIVVLVAAGAVLADEVVFRNGDRLSGTIEQIVAGKMTVKSTVAGLVTVDMKDVRTFSTDRAVEIQLGDGSVLKSAVAAGDEGRITTRGTDVVRGQTVPLSSVMALDPPKVKWAGSVSVGGTMARGNSSSETLSVSAEAMRRGENDRISGAAGYLFGRQRDPSTGSKSETTNNWFGQAKYDYFFTKKFYGYGNVRLEHDTIADLDIRVAPGVGVGYQWVERPDLNFSTEVGVSWVYEKYATQPDSDNRAAVRLAYHVDKRLNERVTLFHNLEYLPGLNDLSDYNLNVDAGLRASLTRSMFTEFKFQLNYDSMPAPGRGDTDLRYILSVGWSF